MFTELDPEPARNVGSATGHRDIEPIAAIMGDKAAKTFLATQIPQFLCIPDEAHDLSPSIV
ncbi:hypothetical protein ACSMXM_04875 [Pacificimonas sp. ICDLI1SI03]